MNSISRVRHFLGTTVLELKKSVWPTRSELRDSTIVVVIATLLLGAYISLSDFAVYSWIEFLTNLVRS